jgi:hypothetical protein
VALASDAKVDGLSLSSLDAPLPHVRTGVPSAPAPADARGQPVDSEGAERLLLGHYGFAWTCERKQAMAAGDLDARIHLWLDMLNAANRVEYCNVVRDNRSRGLAMEDIVRNTFARQCFLATSLLHPFASQTSASSCARGLSRCRRLHTPENSLRITALAAAKAFNSNPRPSSPSVHHFFTFLLLPLSSRPPFYSGAACGCL